jgi:hypothetical protein
MKNVRLDELRNEFHETCKTNVFFELSYLSSDKHRDAVFDWFAKRLLKIQPATISKMENVNLDELQDIIEDCIGHSDLNVIPELCSTLDEETTALAKNIINSILHYLQKPVESDAVEFAEYLNKNYNRTNHYFYKELYERFKQLNK